MQLVNDYLELEKIRYERKLQTSIVMDEEIATAKVLPLSIQVLVENAIKHGVAKRKEGGTVTVRINKKEDTLVASVESPGTLDKSHTYGVGLKNLAERIQLQYGTKGSFQISQEQTDVVIATIITPFV